MAAPVLTASEQKAALSAKKRKKKVIKNILGLPSSVKVESPVIEPNETERLSRILERLLPPVRLPVQKLGKDKTEYADKTEAKNKRNQLSLGVNSVNKNIKKELLSAVLLASDIQPKFLIHNLNLLCSHNKVPFIHMPGLRNITKSCLGFPCIALGFKKDFSDFVEAVDEIKSIFKARQFVTNNEASEESEEDTEQVDDFCGGIEEKEDDIPFSYLYRSSTKERVFTPEGSCSALSRESESGFISIQMDNNESKPLGVTELGISSNLNKKQKKNKVLRPGDFNNSKSGDEEDLEMPKKKKKKLWVVDKAGKESRLRYSPANIMKAHSNPERISKKRK